MSLSKLSLPVSLLSKLETLDSLDLLLSDVVLPGGLSGRGLAQKIAQQRPDVKVLLMSGYAAEVLLEEGELAPGTELLHKPFRKAELARKVRSALDTANFLRLYKIHLLSFG